LFMESVFYGSVLRRHPWLLDAESLSVMLGLAKVKTSLTLRILGIFLVSFFACIKVLLWVDRWFKPFHTVNFKMLSAALIMFTLASLDVAFHLRHNLEAFVIYEGDPIEEFERTGYWLSVGKMVTYVAQTFVGDLILVRCYH